MNILPVNRITAPNYNLYNSQNIGYNRSYGLQLQKPLAADTVSFKCAVKFDKILETNAAKNNEKLKIPAKNYMAVLQAVATDLRDYGVSFDRLRCEPNSIKSAKSVVSKIKRSKTFIVPDRIRGTLYCKNIYDMSVLFNKILPALEEYGYYVRDTEIPVEEAMKRGYKPSPEEIKRGIVNYPDIDIRLKDDDEDNPIKNIESIPDDKKCCLGKPQSSGYEDIQIRLEKIDDTQTDLKKHRKQKFWHELIILTGEEYDKTKHDESEHIYAYTRQFQELNIYNKDFEDIAELKRYISLIRKTFSNEITQNVYENAKSRDMLGITEALAISITEKNEKSLTECYDEIENITKRYYKEQIETKAKTEKSKQTLEQERDEDIARLAEIRKGLTEAIEFYKNYPASADGKKKKSNSGKSKV